MQRSPQLDGIRGMAILAVVLFHGVGFGLWGTPETVHLGSLAFDLTSLGYLGVDLFFVLSGFLLGGIVLEHRDSPNLVRAFFLRRIARIVPPYAAWLALFFAAASLVAADSATYNLLLANSAPAWAYATFTQNFLAPVFAGDDGLLKLRAGMLLPTWSLAVEQQFYLLLPFVVRCVPRKALPWTLVGLIVSAPVLRTAIVFYSDQHWLAYTLLPCRWDALFLGVLGAWAMRHRVIGKSAASLGMLASGFGSALAIANGPKNLDPAMLTLGGTLVALTCAAWVVRVALDPRGFGWLAWWPLRWLGQISYGLFLCHFAVHVVTHRLLLDSVPTLANWPVTLLGIGISIALASASWRWFESPLVRWAHRESYAVPTSRQPRAKPTLASSR